MREIISLLISALTALFSGLDFVAPKEDMYQPSATYKVEQGAVDWSTMYSRLIKGDALGSSEPCKESTEVYDGDVVEMQDADGNVICYWPFAGVDYAACSAATTMDEFDDLVKESLKQSIDAGDEMLIIAPYNGVLLNNIAQTEYGTTLTISCPDIGVSFKFTGLDGLFCDLERTKPEDGKWVHQWKDEDAFKGFYFDAKAILGRATADTEVRVFANETQAEDISAEIFVTKEWFS